MDVPDIILYGTTLVSPFHPVTVLSSDHAATMSTPGALRSGYKKPGKDNINISTY